MTAPATLQYEVGGGGIVSYAHGIHGGFTIANGVTIENVASGSGNDTLVGNAAANRLASGDGADSIDGGNGNDTLIGGRGADTLTGGAGADLFQYLTNDDSRVGAGNRDVITDFAQGSDKIDLSALEASHFIGTSNFSGRIGEVRYAAFDGATIIEVDTNGDRFTDVQIELNDFVSMNSGDFLGLDTATSGGGKKIAMTSRAADESFASSQSGDTMMANDPWVASNDGLLIYA